MRNYTFLLLFLMACGSKDASQIPADKLFTLLPSSATNVNFINEVKGTKDFNIIRYRNFYNGGGVAIGDINNDGLPDIYFTANMKPNRLYLNKGNFQFEDITEKAGVAGKKAWSTGVTMVDLNADGLLDIYVCNSGDIQGDNKENELFINNGDLTFTEKAKEYGIADNGLSTHAAFFDYDNDQDLDLYVLNNSFTPIGNFHKFGYENVRKVRDVKGGDRFYKNENGKFTDVSEQVNIYGSEIGFGLGVTVGDINRDGWLDLYISNDFFERDYIYLNQKNGTFKECLPDYFQHLSLASMGADLADLNNDAFPEIFVTDMLPESDKRLKTTTVFDPYDTYKLKLQNDYYFQYTANALHFNNADGTFSEIGHLANVAATDWSWGALLFDMNNDGLRDIYVCNGIYKDLINQDFIKFFANEQAEVLKLITGRTNIETEKLKNSDFDFTKLEEKIPSIQIPNYAFLNNGNLQFQNKADEWGLNQPSFSNGATYSDLDNDGDLDIVVNNVNMECFIYRNNSEKTNQNYLKIKLLGEKPNIFGIGANVLIKHQNQNFYAEQIPTRGFQSSSDFVLHFGLGQIQNIDTLMVNWGNQKAQILTNIKANQTLVLEQKNANLDAIYPNVANTKQPIFTDISEKTTIDFKHTENLYTDFDRERLIPQMLSMQGAKIAVADVNKDGFDDFYVGGAKDQAGSLFIQKNGKFLPTNQTLFEKDKICEDTDALFFDADNDKDLDLYVVSGGSEFLALSPELRDRLYLNDGNGNFKKAENALTDYESGSCVVALDFDQDNDLDLFVGSRTEAGRYGTPPKHLLLQNEKGIFSDVSAKFLPNILAFGMVTDAFATDLDNDQKTDLVLTGDYLPITVFKNLGSKFENATEKFGLQNTNGYWNCLITNDLDNDGDQDIIAGNLGLNSKLKASLEQPITLHVGDFDQNGTYEQILSYYKQGKSYPLPLRDDLVMQMPILKKKYLQYEAYAEQNVEQIFTAEQLKKAKVWTLYQTQSGIFWNENGKFVFKPFPIEAQFSSIYGILAADFDADKQTDLLIGGNFSGLKPEIGKYDALYGLLLKNESNQKFAALKSNASGILIKGEIRDIKMLNEKLVLISRNNEKLVLLERK